MGIPNNFLRVFLTRRNFVSRVPRCDGPSLFEVARSERFISCRKFRCLLEAQTSGSRIRNVSDRFVLQLPTSIQGEFITWLNIGEAPHATPNDGVTW
jgi:hypothetical protein